MQAPLENQSSNEEEILSGGNDDGDFSGEVAADGDEEGTGVGVEKRSHTPLEEELEEEE